MRVESTIVYIRGTSHRARPCRFARWLPGRDGGQARETMDIRCQMRSGMSQVLASRRRHRRAVRVYADEAASISDGRLTAGVGPPPIVTGDWRVNGGAEGAGATVNQSAQPRPTA